jgi:hypothetical protein
MNLLSSYKYLKIYKAQTTNPKRIRRPMTGSRRQKQRLRQIHSNDDENTIRLDVMDSQSQGQVARNEDS